MMKSLTLAFVLTAISAPLAYAQDLPVLVTGAPWLVKAPNGMTVEMTFNADGNGQVKAGILANKVTWSVREGAFCIDGIPGGSSCMELSVAGTSVIGVATDGNQFVFERA